MLFTVGTGVLSVFSSYPQVSRPTSASPKDVIRFLVWKDSKGKTKIHIPSCPNFGYHSKRKCGCFSRVAAEKIPFLTLLAYQAIGRGYLLVTLQLIHLSKNTLPLSPRNKQKQEFPLAKPCVFSSTSSLSCALTYAIEPFYHPYPR